MEGGDERLGHEDEVEDGVCGSEVEDKASVCVRLKTKRLRLWEKRAERKHELREKRKGGESSRGGMQMFFFSFLIEKRVV